MSIEQSPVVCEFRRWQRQAVAESNFSCTSIAFKDSREWRFTDGILRHRSGEFFAIAGIESSAREPALNNWQQPIILQPQIALNGFLLRKRGEHPEILFQGRVEPGNIGGMQLAPTVQSTVGNYTRVHNGRPTNFVEWFLNADKGQAVLDMLQSEEACRYYGKYNRNIVVDIGENTPEDIPQNFRWNNIEVIRALACADNAINTDARSVLASMDWDLLVAPREQFINHPPGSFGNALGLTHRPQPDQQMHSTLDIVEWLSRLRAQLGLRNRIIGLEKLLNWDIDDFSIQERTPRLGFAIRQFKVTAKGREVDSWDQPLIDSSGAGQLTLVCQEKNGLLHFLVKASKEVGYLEGIQLSPSVTIAPGENGTESDPVESALRNLIDDESKCVILQQCCQSEEGGRFFRDEVRYQLVLLESGLTLPASDLYRWLTLNQIRRLIRISGVFSIEFRGALTLLMAYL